MGPVEVVEVLPLLQALVEQAGVVDHDAFEEPVELVGVDAVGSLDPAVEARGGGPDVDVVDAAVEHVPGFRSSWARKARGTASLSTKQASDLVKRADMTRYTSARVWYCSDR